MLDPELVSLVLAFALHWELRHLHCCTVSSTGLTVPLLTDGPQGLFRRDHRTDGLRCHVLDLLADRLCVPEALLYEEETKALDRALSLKSSNLNGGGEQVKKIYFSCSSPEPN